MDILDPKIIRRILLIHYGALGDFILSLPLVGALHETFNLADITVFGCLDYLDLVKGIFHRLTIQSSAHPTIRSLYVHDPDQPPAPLQADLAILLSRHLDPVVAGNLQMAGVSQVRSLDFFPPPGQRLHLSEHLLVQAQAFYPLLRPSPVRLRATPADRAGGKDWLTRHGVDWARPVLAFHPGSGSRLKLWPAANLAALIDWAGLSFNIQPLLISGPADDDAATAVLNLIKSPTPIIARHLPLSELSGILSLCTGLVGHDSGITHLAAALGLRVVTIFGPTDPVIWAPDSPLAIIVSAPTACGPCGLSQAGACPDQICLTSITIDQVKQAATQMMSLNSTRHS
ncbi:MAG: glycosyltransferase family 9 protein [Deltaproteobacteria bacterium]|nr:glycosyltransferase family 9 protein [Deltaproteobacteria bacterium]